MSDVRSMTGFGTAEASDESYRVRVELRTVNHRHFVWKTRFPASLYALEREAERRVREAIRRGSVHLSVDCSMVHEALGATIDRDLAARYLEQLEALQEQLGVPPEAFGPGERFARVLGMPGVVQSPVAEPEADKLRDLFFSVLDEGIAAVVDARRREGASLESELSARVERMSELVAILEAAWPKAVDDYRERLRQRIGDYLAVHGKTLDESDLLRETALAAEKADVTEELIRFSTHVDELRRVLAAGGAIGRRLDFLIQEMQREANTMASKSLDARLSHDVVEIKAEVERVREQVQNLE